MWTIYSFPLSGPLAVDSVLPYTITQPTFHLKSDQQNMGGEHLQYTGEVEVPVEAIQTVDPAVVKSRFCMCRIQVFLGI